MGTGYLSDKWMKDILHTLEKNLNSHFEKEAQRFKRRKDDDYDEVCIYEIFLLIYYCKRLI